MSASNTDFNKLSAIVDQFLIENDLHDGFFPKALAWACRGLREIKLDVAQDVRTALLDVTERKTVKLPQDFVDWVKVGVPHGQYVIQIGINDELNGLGRTTTSPTVRGLASQHLPNGISMESYTFMNYGGSSILGCFVGGSLPSKGYFKLFDDGNCKELLMDYDYSPSQVYIEYITDGLDPCGDTIVSPYLYDYVFKFIEFRYEKKNNPKATNFSIQEAERDVFWAEKKIRARKNNLDPQTVLNLSRQETRLTPHL